MQFILEQQARATSKIEALADSHKQLAETQKRAEEKWARTEEGIRSLLTIAEIHEREITSLDEAQLRLVEAQTRIAEAQARTDEKMAETDERLNALINTVERFISKGRNGEQR